MKRILFSLPILLLTPVDAFAQPQTLALDIDSEALPEFVCVAQYGVASTKVVPDTSAAKEAMATPDPGVCGSSHPACSARLDLPAGASELLCARNAPWVKPTGRVLIVDLRSSGDVGRSVLDLHLEGAVARLSLAGVLPTEGLHARVIGGHYQPGPAVLPTGQRFAIRTKPRCSTRVIDLPRRALAGTGELDVELSQDGHEPLRCKHPVAHSLVMALPEGTPGARARLQVAVASQDESSRSRVEASWWTTRPPETIELRPTSLSFTWKFPCEYPGRDCPQADMVEAGLSCTADAPLPTGRTDHSDFACAYRCVPSSGMVMSSSWPLSVSFRAPDGSVAWPAQLEVDGQVLETYLPEESMSFPVRFAWEEKSRELLNRPGDRIRLVEVITPRGVVHRLEPRDGLRVTLPGARCGDTFDSRVVGDRKFEVDTARIEGGWLVIPDPQASAHGLHVGGMLGGGFNLPASRFGLPGPGGLESRAYGTVQLALRLQPDPRVHGSVFVPRAYEMHLSYVIAQQPFFPVHVPGRDENQEAEYLAFNRWALEAMPMWQLGQRTQLGMGMGIGLGFPVRTMDVPALGSSRLFFIPFTALGRIQISQAVSFEGSFRLVGPETVYRYEPSPLFAGTPERKEETLWSGMLGVVGVRVFL